MSTTTSDATEPIIPDSQGGKEDFLSTLRGAEAQMTPDMRVRLLSESMRTFFADKPEKLKDISRATIPDRETFIKEGSPPKMVYVLLKGSVDVHALDKSGKQKYIAGRTAPTILGEISLFTNKTTANVTAKGDIEVLQIPAILCREMLDTDSRVVKNYRKLVLKRLAENERFNDAEPADQKALGELRSAADKAPPGPQKTILEAFAAYAQRHPDKGNMFWKKSFAKGADIITEGGQGVATKECYFILSGEVGVHKWSEDAGVSVYVGNAPAGSVVGEQAVIDPRKGRSATVRANSDVSTLIIRQEVLEELVRGNPNFRPALDALRSAHMTGDGRGIAAQKELLDHQAADPVSDVRDLMQMATDSEEIDQFIGFYNTLNPRKPELAWFVVHRTEEGVVTFDRDGKLYFQELNKENARNVLATVKLETNDLLEGSLKGSETDRNGYQLRMECLRRDPSIPSHEAFTWGAIPINGESDFIPYLTNKAHWLPQRLALQKQIDNDAIVAARGLSSRIQGNLDRLGLPSPALIMMKGNTGAGKTSTVKSKLGDLPDLGILDDRGQPSGVINPDELKNPLRTDAKLDGRHTVTHSQVFAEGGARGYGVTSQVMQEKLNIVLDKRFCTEKEMAYALDLAKKSGYKTTVVIDVDAEGETSINRVYGDEQGKGGRDPDGDDPIVPLLAITTGFQDTRAERKNIIARLEKENSEPDGLRSLYFLYKTDHAVPPPGQRIPPKLIAKMTATDKTVSAASNEQDRFGTLTSPISDNEFERINGLLAAREAARRKIE